MRLGFAFLFLLVLGFSPAHAQCNGVFSAGQVCGSVSGGPPGPAASGSFPLPTISPSQVLGNNSSVNAPATGVVARMQHSTVAFYVNSSTSATAVCNGVTCSVGSDSNTCLDNGHACNTLQHVLNLIFASYDFENTVPTIYLARTAGISGSNPLNYQVSCANGPFIGAAVADIIGDTVTPSNVQIQGPDGGTNIFVANGCTMEVEGAELIDSPATSATSFIQTGGGHGFAHLDLSVQFGACANCIALDVDSGSSVTMVGGNCAVVGSETFAFRVRAGGDLSFNSLSCPVSNNLTFTTFALVSQNGVLRGLTSSTFGSPTGITGTRCQWTGPITFNSNINPNTIFPGNVDCVQTESVGAIGLQNGSGGSSTINYGTAGQPLLSGAGSVNTWGTALGTASAQNTGTSGATVPLLNGNNQFSGQIIPAYGTPTIASGACGATTNGTLAAGSTNQSGEVIIASASTTTCTISFSATLSAAPLACVLEPGNAQAATELANSYISAITTGHWVITGTALASTDYYYHCF